MGEAGLEQAYWREGPGILRLLPAHCGVELGSGVPGYRTLGVPDLAPAHWCVGLGPGPSGGQDQVSGKLGTLEVLRYLTFSWVGLCSCPEMYLA